MKKTLRYLSFFGGILITFLGLVILLMESNMGHRPHLLININLTLVFLVGALVISYIVVNKGI